jgi:ribosomal protein S18 acetylase RimI-like enzyme
MTPEEFSHYSQFSYDRFISSSSASSGEPLEQVKTRVGPSPQRAGKNDMWYVVELDTKNIGYFWIQLLPQRNEAFIYDLYLDGAFRGKGLGREVMSEAIRLLKGRNVESVKLCVFRDNPVALHLYQSLGFQEIEFRTANNQYVMELKL